MQNEPILKQLEYLAFPDSALTDEDKHHTAIDQVGNLLCVLWTRNKFHKLIFLQK